MNIVYITFFVHWYCFLNTVNMAKGLSATMFVSNLLSLEVSVGLLIFISLAHQVTGGVPCPCKDPSLCNVVSQNYDRQVFAFSMHQENFKGYDFTRLGTIATTYSDNDPQLVCYAHAHNTRVVSMANFPVTNLTDPSTFKPWVQAVIEHVQSRFLDGVNVDFESPIPKSDIKTRDGFTKLIGMLTTALKLINSDYQVSIDFAWSPNCIDSRCYDYASLAQIVDYAFVMSYDERSQFNYPCIAWANSPYNMTTLGLKQYLDLGIPAEKLILGVPWYGYSYPCISYDKTTHTCGIKKSSFRGSECSDAAGRQLSYSLIWTEGLLERSDTGRLWDPTAKAPYLSYKDSSGAQYQYWYDDVESLTMKYQYAIQELGLAGVGMWQADALDYSNHTQVDDMWKAMPERQPSQHPQRNPSINIL